MRRTLENEALKAGIVDLDGLKLLDLSSCQVNENGELEEAEALIADLKRSKPWLFENSICSGVASESSRARKPGKLLSGDRPNGDAGLRPAFGDIPTASKILGLSRSAIYRGLADGSLLARKHGKRLMIDLEHGIRWMNSLPVARIGAGGSDAE